MTTPDNPSILTDREFIINGIPAWITAVIAILIPAAGVSGWWLHGRSLQRIELKTAQTPRAQMSGYLSQAQLENGLFAVAIVRLSNVGQVDYQLENVKAVLRRSKLPIELVTPSEDELDSDVPVVSTHSADSASGFSSSGRLIDPFRKDGSKDVSFQSQLDNEIELEYELSQHGDGIIHVGESAAVQFAVSITPRDVDELFVIDVEITNMAGDKTETRRWSQMFGTGAIGWELLNNARQSDSIEAVPDAPAPAD